MNVLSLCTGIGGLDLGIKMACPEARTVCCCEIDPYCRAVLLARMADGRFDACPIWDDLRLFDGRSWRDVVDTVAAGFPCQSWSFAGKRKEFEDERWIWPEIVRIVRDVEPALIFLENVPGLLVRGLGAVLGEVANLGLDAEWTCVSAASQGAPHLRERVFVLAYTPGERRVRRLVGGDSTAEATRREPSERCQDRQFVEVGATTPAGVRGAWRWPGEPGVQRMVDRSAAGMDRLKALGNAVVPQQAAAAFTELRRRIED